MASIVYEMNRDEERLSLLKRAKEYAEFYEATKNFNTLGYFNDLIKYLSEEDNG